MANPTPPAPAAPTPPVAKGVPTTPPAKAPEPTPAEIRKLRLTLEGQDVEMPEQEVIALAQQGRVAAKRFQEAADLRRKAEEVIRFANENPAEFFKKTGKNAREWAESFLMEELKREQMSPEQKKAAENEEKLRQYEKERKDAAESARRANEEVLTKAKVQELNELFIDALAKSGLPRVAYTVKRMAELYAVARKKGIPPNPEHMAKIVREDYQAEHKSLYGPMEGDQLLDFLGPEIVKKLAKAHVGRLKTKGARGTNASGPTRPGEPKRNLTWREYQLRNRGRLPK